MEHAQYSAEWRRFVLTVNNHWISDRNECLDEMDNIKRILRIM
jgi:hypothetical protein